MGAGPAVLGVDMDGDEQVRIVVVGEAGPFVQRNVPVVGAGHQGLDVRVRLADFPGKPVRDVQCDGLLVGFLVPADASGIMAAVTGIDDDGTDPDGILLRLCRHGSC